MPDFLLDENGLQTPRLLPDVRARVVEVWRSKFGQNAQTASDSPDGLIIDTLSILLHQHWEAVTDVYQGGYFRTAGLVDLAKILDVFGKAPLAAERATVELVWYGTDATDVLEGSIAHTSDDVRFATDADATVDGDVWVVRVNEAVALTDYGIEIDSTTAGPITSDASPTMAEIVADLVEALQDDGHTAFAGGVDLQGRGLVVIDVTPASPPPTITDGDMTVFHAVRSAATCTVEGEVVALAGTVVSIATPIVGIEGVTTTADAVGGRDVETAAEYRRRHLATLNSGGNASVEAIRAHLLEVDDVVQVTVLNNRTDDDPDANGLPPHSVEALVLGGTDADIAQALYESVSAGDRTFGSTTVVVVDGSNAEPISFSRPTLLYAHLEISITDGEGYPTVGTPLTTIRDAVIAYLTDAATAPEMGEDLYRVQLTGPIVLAVPGIAGVTIRTDTTAAPGDPPTFAASDITVAARELLQFDSGRVTMIQL